jgi:hypothetical protein
VFIELIRTQSFAASKRLQGWEPLSTIQRHTPIAPHTTDDDVRDYERRRSSWLVGGQGKKRLPAVATRSTEAMSLPVAR